jgi:hypothetical protein
MIIKLPRAATMRVLLPMKEHSLMHPRAQIISFSSFCCKHL